MMISTDKTDAVPNLIDTGTINSTKPNKWNEQPHIGKYKLIKTIGKGNFAKVKLAQHVTTGKKVAVKVIDKTALNNSSLQKLFREVTIMKTLEHPNIVKLFEVIESERHVYLVMEYASRGEVFDFLVQNGRMKEREARQRFREIVSAIQYCHHKNIVHRDLKAENLLLSGDLEIKIADFGFANNYDCKKQLDTFCGSPPYAAPELFQGRKYEGPEVDVWSLGVILYTLVSGSLPFDGHNMRELRERVLRGKYRIPFYMSTDCELLLKKMLIVSPHKRYTLLEVMKDKWINIGYEDCMLQPYKEPTKNYDDPVRLAIMENLGFSKEEVLDSMYNAKFNNVTATYLLLDHDVNNALENSSKSASVSSLKNINSFLVPKDTSKVLSGNDKSSKGVARSGSAVEARGSAKVATNGDNEDPHYNNQKENPVHIGDNDGHYNEASLKLKSVKINRRIKQSPSMGTTNTYSNEDGTQLTNASLISRPNPIRIPGIQPNISSIVPKLIDEKTELNNGDNLLMPIKNTWVKRNNTFTYADKNTASEIESKPVTRTKHVMNMLSNVTPAPIPLTLDQPVTINSKKHGSNDVIIKIKKSHDASSNQEVDETFMTDSTTENINVKINEPPSATGDRLNLNNLTSEDNNNIMVISVDEAAHNSSNDPCISHQTPETTASVTNSKEINEGYPQLNKPKPVHTNSLLRSFTNKIASSKLIRRLTAQNPSTNKNKRTSDYDACNSADPWTPMDTTTASTTDHRKISASSDLTSNKHSYIDKAHQTYTLKPNQSKPRLMHLVFRKSLTSKLRPETIISEMLKSICLTEEIEFKKIEQIDTFVIECQGKLKSEQGGNELIHWEIEVFRLPRSSSFGVRIKKECGSSTRFKAIQKILVNRLSPVLCTNPHVVSTN